jgi:hypothetical protein
MDFIREEYLDWNKDLQVRGTEKGEAITNTNF